MSITQITTSEIKDATIVNADQNFGSPSAATDVAIKSYVDNLVQGLAPKPSAIAASAAALSPANTYSAGVLTATGNGVLTVDGVALSLNDYVLVKDEASQLKNGLYKVTTAGTASVPYVLTRAVEMDASTEFNGAYVFIESGTVNASSGWVSSVVNPTIGTTAITFVQFSGAGEITPGNGLSKSGNSLTIDTSITVDKTTAQTLTNKTFTAPVMTAPVLGTPASGNLANCTFPTLNQNTTGNAATVTTNANLTGDVTSVGNAATLAVFFRQITVTGTQDGSNKTFTLANTPKTNSEMIVINGITLRPGSSYDYTLSGVTVTLTASFPAPSSTANVIAYGTY